MSTSPEGLLAPLFGSAAANVIFSDIGRIQAMLDFEAGLARAEASLGIIPSDAARAISSCCRAEFFDVVSLAVETELAGVPSIPLVKHLTARVATENPDAARFVHWGATSQDLMDTGLILQLRAALSPIEKDLARLSDALANLAERHKLTPMAGRTWLQHALPVTFGLKAAGWLDAVERHRARLAAIKSHLLVLQFGGAAGTLAALGDRGLDVAIELARTLGLGLPALPWHTERDRLAELATTLGLIIGTLGKMARDLSLLMQTDVGEAFEPAGEGRGGSSTMPHKRNPVAAAAILAAATRAPGLVATMLTAMMQEHERGLGNWHAEWAVLPELVTLTAGALFKMADTMAGLEIDEARMRANIEITKGLMMAEAVTMAAAEKLGKQAAHHRIEKACRRAVAEKKHLQDILAEDSELIAAIAPAKLEELFDPLSYLGMTAQMIDRVLTVRKK